MSDVVLELRGIHKSYNRAAANALSVLEDVNVSLHKGEISALVAPSGAGKSTLLHIAGLLDTPDLGDVYLRGSAIGKAGDRRRTTARRQDIGFVYQFHHLLPEFTAQENIALPQLANGTRKTAADARAMELLNSVGVGERATHRPAALSGGEQQRVAFCRAMANTPKLLLADEPTGNLDPETSDRVFGALVKLVRETGLSALIATHNLELAAQMDRMLRLDGGVLREA